MNTYQQRYFNRTYLWICFLAVLLLLLATSCNPTTQIQVLQPAAFTIPDHIETVVTINRSIPPKKFWNAVEGLITGENIGQDKEGARYALGALTDALTRTPRFAVKQSGLEMEGSGSFSLPVPLPWSEVNRLCQQYNADALVALEAYDTDILQNCDPREIKSKDKEGNTKIETRYDARLSTDVKLAWRMYDPKNQQIIDEFTVAEGLDWKESGDTHDGAINRLPNRQFTVNETSAAAGGAYGMRIAPIWITVERTYFKDHKKTPQMENANRFAKVGNWKSAASQWQILVNSTDKELAGKAAYNMAVANEVEGKLSSALEWAEMSYTQFGNKKAKSYIQTLRQRIYEQEQVNQQMNLR
ncbi:MAG: DUF6340 family protein [Chitinophagales bacterium]